ncbi:MAG: methylenetetrahydrofolate--tRNA-(uracil-5-)-methyltransferase TrmFO [Gemmatimonadota bacterium]|nr:MAG: methylenetetrahydrofolate--tRNA-(uracil-5-)-methyltransferase TrmFO [Gemmatimonadota bacterium]
MATRVTVIGAGLSGSEAALQLAVRGVPVDLYEMRPTVPTEAHQTDRLAEIVCSNSFKSMSGTHASGLLKEEMKALGSFLIPIAEECRVEAGTALAVDRDQFAEAVTRRVTAQANITVHREELRDLPKEGPVIVATGPLTSAALTESLTRFLDLGELYFYDSTAPIVSAESIDRDIAFEANRRDAGVGHYLNCPFTEEQYLAFHEALLAAEKYPLHDFEKATFFEACLPIDELAARGPKTLCFGPMRPIGLIDPATGRRPHAVVQLRAENRAGTAFNLVGCQNRMRHGDQKRVLRMIPGLERAEFYRLGRIHRNTYLNAPKVLDPFLAVEREPRVSLAGQITGLEGYVEAVATGMLAGQFTAARLRNERLDRFPRESALGSLMEFVSGYEGKEYRPTNVNFGLFPPLEERLRKGPERNAAITERARAAMTDWLARHPTHVFS